MSEAWLFGYGVTGLPGHLRALMQACFRLGTPSGLLSAGSRPLCPFLEQLVHMFSKLAESLVQIRVHVVTGLGDRNELSFLTCR